MKETLSIVQNFDGIPRHKVEFFNDVLSPLYKSKTEPNKNEDGSKKEDIIAVTTKELCNFYKEKKGKIINTDNLKKTFLYELENNGIIDYEISKIHGQQDIYYPLVEPFDNNNNSETSSFLSNLGQFDQISQYSSTIYEKIITILTEKQVFHEIEQVFPHRIDLTQFTTEAKEEELEVYLDMHTDELKIVDANDNDKDTIIITRQFIQDYLSDSEISKNQFDDKRSPNMPPFDKTSQFSSNLDNFDDKDEKSPLFNNPLISEEDLKDPTGYQYDPEIINNIHRFGNSDRWFCDNCILRDDKFGMMRHPCKHKDKSEAS